MGRAHGRVIGLTTTPTAKNKPSWDVPFPYGQSGAIDNMGSIAAPFLAGISATLLLLVIQNAEAFRWPGIVLLLLVGASLFLLSALQFTFWVRRYVITPGELQAWWPSLPHDDSELRWEQQFHRDRERAWSRRARRAYNCGLLCFLAALPVALVPQGHIDRWRYAAIVVAVAGFTLEAVWVALIARRLDKGERA